MKKQTAHYLSRRRTTMLCTSNGKKDKEKMREQLLNIIIIIFHTVQDTFSVYCVPGSTPVPQNPMNAMVMVMVKLILNATSPYPSPLHPHPPPPLRLSLTPHIEPLKLTACGPDTPSPPHVTSAGLLSAACLG